MSNGLDPDQDRQNPNCLQGYQQTRKLPLARNDLNKKKCVKHINLCNPYAKP